LAGVLWRLSVTTGAEAEEAVAELLGRMSSEPVATWRDQRTGLSTAVVYLRDASWWSATRGSELREGLRRIGECGLEIEPARVRWSRVAPEDWRESWKRHFPPILIGRRLLVRPGWSRKRPEAGQVEVVLDPGLSFGTGQHPTTAFCLEEIVRLSRRAASGGLLDVGTGSGILAIAAARLGYEPVEGIDVDPEAIGVALKNARRNRVLDRMRLSRRDVARLGTAPRRRFGVVCANLTADLLRRHAARLLGQLQPGGCLVVAGILRVEFDGVEACLGGLGMGLVRSRASGEWRSGSFAGQADF
jgi:ribosomal protein L11 methyltransferase